MIHLENSSESSQNESIYHEILCHRQMGQDHENIIQFMGYVTFDMPNGDNTRVKRPFMVYKWIEGVLLYKIPPDLDYSLQFFIALGIAKGLEFIHSKNIIHRDLAPKNILVDNNHTPHIIDFGFSRLRGQSSSSNVGTDGYMAPEVGKPTFRMDIYSFGKILNDYLKKLLEQSKIQDLRNRCCDLVPKKRPTAKGVVKILDECLLHQLER